MSITFRTAILGFLMLAMFPISGCGEASNNDQGTSFTATGFFTDSTGETGLTGIDVASGIDNPVVTDPQANNVLVEGRYTVIYMGLENRMTRQFVRVTRIECSYEVEGASIAIPSDSFNSSLVVPAGTSAAAAEGQAATVEPGQAFVGFEVLSVDLFSFLNNNIADFPQRPFRLIATCTAVGVTQAGDAIESNPLYFPIVISETAECCFGEGLTPSNGGYQTGTGTGGTITFAEETTTTTGTSTTGAPATETSETAEEEPAEE